MFPRKFCIPLVFAVLLFAIGAWGYSVMSRGRLNEASLRDVSGVEVQAEDALVSPKGLIVHCWVKNRTRHIASSVVFTVEIATEDGRILAENPLGNILGLKPGESRAIQVPMPAIPELPSSHLTRARVDLVRWQQ